jgi:hypothetical protein
VHPLHGEPRRIELVAHGSRGHGDAGGSASTLIRTSTGLPLVHHGQPSFHVTGASIVSRPMW